MNSNDVHNSIIRRKRIQLYKKIIVSVFLLCLTLPFIITIGMFIKVHQLETKIDFLVENKMDKEYSTFASSTPVETQPLTMPYGTESEEHNIGNLENTTEDITETKKVYLTFDDGPSIYTDEILDILAENNVKATFFVIGREDESYWPYYQRIVDDGHTLGMHSYTHVYCDIYSSKEDFINDVDTLSDFLYERTGVRSKIYRFPGGSSNSVCNIPMEELVEYLDEQDIEYYDWNALNGDAVTKDLSPWKLVDNIMYDVRKHENSIVLMHDLQSRHTTVESLQLLIDTLKSEGYEILPIDENTPVIQHRTFDYED